MDAQDFSSLGVIAAGLVHGAHDHLFLGLGDGLMIAGNVHAGRPFGFKYGFRQIFGQNELGRTQYYGTLDGVLQFAHVARLVVICEAYARLG